MFAILKLNHKMTFGKYKGEVLIDVINKDPQYIIWCAGNIEGFYLHPECKEDLERSFEAHAFSDLYPDGPDDDYFDGEWGDHLYADMEW